MLAWSSLVTGYMSPWMNTLVMLFQVICPAVLTCTMKLGSESPNVIWSVDNGGTLEREQAASECPTPSLARDSEVAAVATTRPQPTVGHGQWQLGELQTTHSLHSGLQIFCCLGRQEFLLNFFWTFKFTGASFTSMAPFSPCSNCRCLVLSCI